MQPEITIELNQLAIVTALVVGFAFLLGLHPFKKKQRLVLSSPENMSLWTAGDYFTFVNSLILSSKSLEQLQKTMDLIDGYFDKPFRVPISSVEVKKNYQRLLESYCEMERKFENIPLELCKN